MLAVKLGGRLRQPLRHLRFGAALQLHQQRVAGLVQAVVAAQHAQHVAQQLGGKGGGKPDMAMAGGTGAAQLPAALASVQAWVAERL